MNRGLKEQAMVKILATAEYLAEIVPMNRGLKGVRVPSASIVAGFLQRLSR